MKEVQQSTLTTAGAAVPRRWRLEQLPRFTPRSDGTPVSSAEEIQTKMSNIVLLFLDLARVTGDAAYLDVATAGAKHLAKAWNRMSTRPPIIRSPDKLSSARSLSRVALALAETWKATKDPVYRRAGLNIIRYLDKAASAAGRKSDAVYRGEKR